MARTTQYLLEEIACFDRLEQVWKSDHTQAMSCHALEEGIAFLNFVFGRIQFIDKEWSDELLAASVRPQLADAKAMQAIYDNWRKRAESVIRQANELADQGHVVRGLSELRVAHRDAVAVAAIPVERIHMAAQNPDGGRARSTAEMRDELHRAMGTGG